MDTAHNFGIYTTVRIGQAERCGRGAISAGLRGCTSAGMEWTSIDLPNAAVVSLAIGNTLIGAKNIAVAKKLPTFKL